MRSTQLSILCLAVLVSYCSSLTIPNGYLLVFKASGENWYKISLFQVTFSGTVQQLWNYTLGYLDNPNLFAVDIKNQLVYIGVTNQLLALGQKTGKVIINKPLNASVFNYFMSYNYVQEENAIYGMCAGSDDRYDWCRIKLGVPEFKLESLYHLPGTSGLNQPSLTPYYMDKTRQTVWYYIGYDDCHGLDYTTGEEIFHSKSTIPFGDACVAHDHMLNRTFAIALGPSGSDNSILTELHPLPQNETRLLDLPSGIDPAELCDYDQETHTMIALMFKASANITDLMPTQLLLIDVVGLSYKSVALPEFRKWADDWPATGVKYIKN